jgi:hypothetical protein
MRRVALWAVLGIAGLAGCGVRGTWKVDTIRPEAARAQFPIEELTLRGDGTAHVRYWVGDRLTEADGTYESHAGELVLKTAALASPLRADTLLSDLDLYLRLTYSVHDDVIEVTFRRVR